MLLKIVFWGLVALDVLAIGLFLLLGLAAAGASRTSSLLTALYMVVVPGGLLAGAVALFVMARAPWWRGLALLVAAAPLLFVVLGRLGSEVLIRQYQDEEGNLTAFRSEGMKKLEAAIVRNDVEGVKAAVRGANLKEKSLDGATVLVVALRNLKKTKGSPEVLRVLLESGADPNAKQMEMPLTWAIMASHEAGAEPVRMLLAAGANPNAIDEFGSPVYFLGVGASVDPEVLGVLVERGADLKLKARDGSNVLSHAVLVRNWKAALLLLDKGMDWKQTKMPNGLPLDAYVESEARSSRMGTELMQLMQRIKEQR